MSNPRALNAFLSLYLQDQVAGRRRTLEEYQSIFPGNEQMVAERYGHYENDGADRAAAGASPSPFALDHVGPYRILQELGRGGQGVVYLAEDTRLHRKVALKVLSGARIARGRRSHGAVPARGRGRVEARSSRDLPPSTTRGVEQGLPYIAMRYVEGETLARQISTREGARRMHARSHRRRTSPRTAARTRGGSPIRRDRGPRSSRLIERAARALHAAHEAGVIHRDVKPGNIMVDLDGRAGHPRLRARARRGGRPRPRSRRPATSSGRRPTCRPSRSSEQRDPRSTGEPTSTRSASRSTSA